MSNDLNDDLEPRLRAHLQKIADSPAPAGLEQRVAASVQEPSRVTWSASLVLVTVLVLAIALVIVISTGHLTNNTFSNVSSGLGT